MKSSAPWSVKGIERDARETAKEAAKREGMTVGEWLNQMIYSAGDAESSGGEVEGLKLRDLVTAIEHLHKRVGETSTKNADAINDLTRNLGGAVERLQRLERAGPAEGGAGLSAEILDRIEKLERDGGDRQRIDALRALEKAVSQVAAQFNTAHKASLERLDSTERQLQQLASRIDEGAGASSDGDASSVNFLKDAIDGLSTRIARAERIAAEAAKLKEAAATSADPEFVERTGERLRVLGDEIKRGGDQIRTLEATIGKLAGQIEAAERRSSEGVQKVAETIAEMRQNFTGGDAGRADIEEAVSAAQRETEERIAKLQMSFDRMIDKLDTLGGARGVEAPAAEDARATNAASADEKIAPPSFEIEEEDEDPFALFDDLDDKDAAAPATESNAEQSALATGEDGSESETEDPFAFISDAADEIDDELSDFGDDADSSAKADDFSFEIEDDAQNANQSQSLLDEVRAAFGTRGASASDVSNNDEPSQRDADERKARERAAAKALLVGNAPQIYKDVDQSEAETETAATKEIDDKPEDYLRAARRRAQEAAARASSDDSGAKRKLTPKQRAILAARARKRKEAAAKNAEQPETIAALAKPVEIAKTPASDDQEDEPRSKFAAAIAALKARLPGGSAKDDDDSDTGANDAEATKNGPADKEDHRTAFATLKSTASARPLTLVLAVAICLSIAALFFLVKDMIFRPAPEPAPARPAAEVQAEPARVADARAAAVDDSRLINAPDAATIDPRAVYISATADLGAATTDAQTRTAIEQLQQSAALGYPPAQLQLGELYRSGQGIDQDLGQARVWFRRAANGGNVLAMHRIGIMTARGDGGPEDSSEAIAWFEAAANHGLVDSQYNLGTIFHPRADAAGTLSDAEKSYYWYSLAGRNGDTEAADAATALSSQITADARAEIDARVAAWAPAPADAEANEFSTASAAG